MFDWFVESIQLALEARWAGRLPTILVSARNWATGALSHPKDYETMLQQAYLAGYRQAYWDGVEDFIASGMEVPEANFGVPKAVDMTAFVQ